MTVQPALLDSAIVGVYEISRGNANDLLVQWEHRLGPCNRPFRQEHYVLSGRDGEPLGVAVSASAVSATVAGYTRQQVVELARLCAHPDASWANRVMLRLWRERLAQRWASWPVTAAISYSHNTHHSGNLYRFDGWERVADDCGSMGGGAWSRQRYASEAVVGRKTLWVWRFA